jgi:hypothetical protein
MIIAEIHEPLILRPKNEECFIIKKSIAGGYLITTAWAGEGKLNGKIIIEPGVEPVIREKGAS